MSNSGYLSGGPIGFQGRWPNWRDTFLGPFGGYGDSQTLWVVLTDVRIEGGAERVIVYVLISTDGGSTWSEEAVKTDLPSGPSHSIDATEVGQHLVIGVNANHDARIMTYDRANATFGSVYSFGVGSNLNHISLRSIFTAANDRWKVTLVSSQQQSISGTPYNRYALFGVDRDTESVILNNPFADDTASHVDVRGLILLGDRIQVFYTYRSLDQLRSRSMDISTDTSGSHVLISDEVDATQAYCIGRPCVAGSEIVIPFTTAIGDLKVARASSAADPSWVIEDIPSGPVKVTGSNSVTVLYDDVTNSLHLGYVNTNEEIVLMRQMSGSWVAISSMPSSDVRGFSLGWGSGTDLGIVYAEGALDLVRYQAVLNVLPAPRTASAKGVSESQIDVRWELVNGAQGYEIERDDSIIASVSL